MTGTTLLLLSGAETGTARALRERGHTLVVMDADPQAPAFAFADSCLIADVWRADDCAAASERYNRKIRRIDGVLSAADTPMTLASVSARLRLAGLPVHVGELANDRLMIARAFLSAGVPQPWQAEIRTPQELQRALIARGRDLTLKPAEKLGPSTELHMAKTDDPVAAFQLVRSASPSGRVLVEQVKDAASLSAFLLAGRCHMRADEDVRALVERAASALGITDGPVAAAIAQTDGAAQLVELAPRLGTSCEFLEAAIALACGESVSPHDLMI
ncbi:MAG TPA: hypothetical protein VGH23_08380 [Rhizomicrobium sp.]